MKIWLIIAACLVLVGLLLFVMIMTTNGWDFRKLSTMKYVTNAYDITDDFENISIDTRTADIVFLLSDDDTCRVVCEEEEKLRHSVFVSGGTLTVSIVDARAWYDYIGIGGRVSKITVYMPKGEYGALSIKNSTGDVQIPSGLSLRSIDALGSTGHVNCGANVSELVKIKTSTGNVSLQNTNVGALDIKVSTGAVSISDVTSTGDVKIEVSTGKTNISDLSCRNLFSDGDTGYIYLKNVISSQKFDIERSTGDITLESCDASEIYVETDTGDVRGNLLSEKVFVVKTDTGRIDVPKSISGGICEIETDTGDIKISIG